MRTLRNLRNLRINTHKGPCSYNVPSPLRSSRSTWSFPENHGGFASSPSTGALLNNILITGPSTEEHLDNIEKVLRRLSETCLRLKVVKCQFMKLECLGHRGDAEGFHPVEAKVEAIQEAPTPKIPTELTSFPGMLNFYGKFIPNLSSILEPLHSLLRKDVVWKWELEQQEAFDKAKNQLQSSDVLVHYDPEQELVVSWWYPSSPFGVSAVLAHVMEDRSQDHVASSSRALSTAERNYGNLDKEALAVAFALKRFHQFL